MTIEAAPSKKGLPVACDSARPSAATRMPGHRRAILEQDDEGGGSFESRTAWNQPSLPLAARNSLNAASVEPPSSRKATPARHRR